MAAGDTQITPLCWLGSPCPTHRALSKAKSAGSNFSRLMFGRANYDLLRKMALLN